MGSRPHTANQLHYPLQRIRARFVRLGGYSGHADQASLVRWVFASMEREQRPVAGRVFVQHGQPHSRRALVSRLKEEAEARGANPFEAEAPGSVDWFDLTRGEWDTTESRRREKEALLSRLAELNRAEALAT
jgi:hypothetical protein